jgi:hypothetical protein
MEINKDYLEGKLEFFKAQFNKTNDELNRQTILLHKYAGAIESTQLLIKELESETADKDLTEKSKQNQK